LLRIRVAGHGCGITEEAQSRLFESFTQGDASTTRTRGGTGLGLAISKRLAEMLGGDITVESAPDVGTTFVLTVATGRLDGVPMLRDPSEVIRIPAEPRPRAAALRLDARGAARRRRDRQSTPPRVLPPRRRRRGRDRRRRDHRVREGHRRERGNTIPTTSS
jgi:hypothetical protein